MNLIAACQTGNLKEVKKLIAEGVDVNAPLAGDLHKQTPLMCAATKGYVEIAQALLDAGADIEQNTVLKNTALMLACMEGERAIVALLIARGARINIEGGIDGSTPLIRAVKAKNLEIVTMLLDAGADINAGDKNNWTALIWATHTKNQEMVELLVAHGANINIIGKDGNTALKRALATNRVKIINLLKQSGAVLENNYEESKKMMTAVKKGNIEDVKQFLAKGLDVNARDSAQWTPLMHACRNGNCEMVKLLLAAGADVNAIGVNDCTALERVMNVLEAIQVDGYVHPKEPAPYIEIIKLLVDAGVDVNKWYDRFTPLIWAVRSGLPLVATWFLDKGANINAQDHISGNTALMWAVFCEKNSKVRKGAEIVEKKVLMDQGGYGDLVDLLISRGANVNVKSKYGETALKEARKYGNTVAVKKLLDAGAYDN